MAVALLALLCGLIKTAAAGEVFAYSSVSNIYGIDLDAGTERLLTVAPSNNSVNALAINREAGYVYYGDNTAVYRWDPALGSGAAAHSLMNDFATGVVQAPITNINSTSGSYLDGIYYVGSEATTGGTLDLWALQMSLDGTQVLSATALNLLTACGCSSNQLGGFGDVTAVNEGGQTVIYGSTGAIATTSPSSGIWRFIPATGSFSLLSSGQGGQLSSSLDGTVYTNIGLSIRELNTTTGQAGSTNILTVSNAIYDFSGGYAMDFGDAPDSYGAAFHRQSSAANWYLGSVAPDNEAGSLNSSSGASNGFGDDNDGIDDEDALTSAPPVNVDSGIYTLTLACSSGTQVAGWLDSNINGQFNAGERNSNGTQLCNSGQVTLQWTGLSTASTGGSWLRLRASGNAAGVASPTGVASSGEVEDYPVTLQSSTGGSGNCPAGSIGQLYQASDLPQSIGPNSNTQTTSTINVSLNETLTDVNITSISGLHTYVSDLDFTLTSGGTSVVLMANQCGSNDNFNLGFDDASSGNIPCPPTTGFSYPPSQLLNAFNGQNASGNWTLSIVDNYNFDGGSLNSWELELCYTDPNPSGGTADYRLGKRVTTSGREVTISLRGLNTGTATLDNAQISDNLDAVFGAGNFILTTAPRLVSAPSSVSLNTSFDGSASNADLLAANTSLAPGDLVEVEFTVRVSTIANTATPGDYTNSAQFSGTDPDSNSVTDLSGDGFDLTTDSDVPSPISIDASSHLSGRVFLDTSSVSSTAHNGKQEANDLPLSGQTVRAIASDGRIVAETTTDTNGDWQLTIAEADAGSTLRIVNPGTGNTVTISEAPLYSTGDVDDGEMIITPGYGRSLSGIDFGHIELATLDISQSQTVPIGVTANLPHVFHAPSHGTVNFSLQSSATPSSPQWLDDLYIDTNCNGIVDGAETTAASSVAVSFQQELCLVIESQAPSAASPGDQNTIILNALFVPSDPALTGHSVQMQRSNTDTITLLAADAGQLVLEKTVRNVSTAGAELNDNAAAPGETLEYRLLYRNDGQSSLDGLKSMTSFRLGQHLSLGHPPADRLKQV